MCKRHFIYFILFWLCSLSKSQAQLTYANVQVQFDSVWHYKNLALVPVRFKAENLGSSGSELKNAISLYDAMRLGKIRLREVLYQHGADVNLLQVTNHGKEPVLITNGELLAGGKQDRVIGESKVLAPGQSDYVKVYCIEKGRWDDKPGAFKYAGAVDAGLRRAMNMNARQQDIWKEIERRFAAENKDAGAGKYLDLKKIAPPADSAYIKFFTSKLKASDSAYAGFVAVTGDRIINCELFAAPNLTMLAFDNLLKALVHTATKGSEPIVDGNRLKTFLDPLLQSAQSQKAFMVGHGVLHEYNGFVFHLVAYP